MAKILSSFPWKLISLVCLLSIPYQSLQAAELRVSPMFQEVQITDTAETPIEVTVTNTTAAAIPFRVAVYDFGNLDQSGGVAFLGASQDLGRNYALAPWVRLGQEAFTLGVGESTVVRATLLNTPDLAPGGHYGAIVFRSTTEGQTETNGIAIEQMIASLIFVNKIGGSQPSVQLENVQERGNWLGVSEVLLNFKNTGNVHITPRGYIELVDAWGFPKAKGIINESSFLILPESQRSILVSLKTIGRSWIPGWYTLRIAHRFDGQEEFQTQEKQLFLFPLSAVGGIGAIVLILSGWLIWKRKRRLELDKSTTV